VKLVDARILITGGGAGIGQFLVESLLDQVTSVAVFELNEARCEALRQQFGDRLVVMQCDVSNAQAVDSSFQDLLSSGFQPNVLINNAGLIHSEPLVNMLSRSDRAHAQDSWRIVLSANLDSVFFVTRRVVDHFLAQRCKGVVISISSISARGNPGQSAYSAAKAGVNALTSAWAKELGAFGLRFAAIAPGFLDTESTRNALSEAVLNKLRNQVPLRRLGELQSVAQAVRYVIENDYVTGTVLDVDGGLTL
jgi:3-oxoacyl-[acyl-carrier protein] reductase